MNIANQWLGALDASITVQTASQSDKKRITRLLQEAPFAHLHADWHYPSDWIGYPTFVYIEKEQGEAAQLSPMSRWTAKKPVVKACLAVAADPAPAAWVRVAAVIEPDEAADNLQAMFSTILDPLREAAVSQIGWLLVERWPKPWFTDLGFKIENYVETYFKEGNAIPNVRKIPGLVIQPLKNEDYPDLVRIEEETYAPLWRHSELSLRTAKNHAVSFDVAHLDGEVVGFQLSTATRSGAHLSRISIKPEFQGKGFGSVLLAHTIRGYQDRGIKITSLNTQSDNLASKKLYERFDFRPNGQRYPVWVVNL